MVHFVQHVNYLTLMFYYCTDSFIVQRDQYDYLLPITAAVYKPYSKNVSVHHDLLRKALKSTHRQHFFSKLIKAVLLVHYAATWRAFLSV